jgi:hypothetical protein
LYGLTSGLDGERLLTDLIQAQPEDVEDCHNRMPVPKLHAYRDHYFSSINGLARGSDERLYFRPLKIFFNPEVADHRHGAYQRIAHAGSRAAGPPSRPGPARLAGCGVHVSLRAGHRD